MYQSFSQRMGIKPVRTVIQKDFMDDSLRVSLWNELTEHYWPSFKNSSINAYKFDSHPDTKSIFEGLWTYHFMRPVDEIDAFWEGPFNEFKSHFFSCPWNEVYDIIQIIPNFCYNEQVNESFIAGCNIILSRELSAYRFVEKVIIPITSDQEIAEIEEALQTSKKFTQHLNKALERLADRKSPDYANSIKESISAVEAICQSITGDHKATLGEALRQLDSKLGGGMHPALKNTFNSIYGYTSDAQGIRHALLGKSDLDVEDAKFMLIACSAFINYLVVKADKAGIQL